MKASSSNTKESPVQHDNPTTSSSLDTPSTSTNSASSPALDHLTITQFSQLSTKTKTGYLYFQKSSSIFTRWKRKYFLLNGNYLRRYTSPDDIEKDEIINYKEFVLTWKSMVISTDIDTCFILKTPPLSDDEGGGQGTAAGTISWTLKCDSPNETKEWMIYLSSHIHGLFLLHRPDLAEIDLTKYEKFTSHTFWILPTSNSAGPVINPVGIRSLPDQYGPRTGEGIYPGEIFEVVQLIHSPTGVIYLRLADDRGWVFDKHPSGGYDLIIQLQPHEYKYQEKSLTLIANNDQVRLLSIMILIIILGIYSCVN